ncbi:NAD(P)/FAD-dependent oxidoreductase [Streptomyces sp. ACA25]|uniref:phytoene desaturase family protein n=1 Tax=Streptomyces sp. ACA25 TaxID=3022596 RepID=UPI00230783F3|nr:NAD(P)/FAD-dependent oxidoreductase [Streptomyces sp. ACA25]MDB1089881.1 NAD(P)/FAD-dependent oxidoreductase [Streptomyces sp. ACA25]
MAGIVVVGAGMGAMAAAARLAVAGHRVTVLERGSTHGGAVRQYTRDGFAFDTGPGLLHLPAVWRDLFVKTGKQPLEECLTLTRVDPAAEHRFADGTAVRLPGFSLGGVRRALDDALGDAAGARWTALLGRGRQTWEATRRPLMEEPLTAGSAAGAALRRDPYPVVRRRGRLRRRPPALADLGRDELQDPRLAALLASSVRDYGIDPRLAPASAAVLAYMEQAFGSWYPLGGLRALADAVHRRCLDRGVEFVMGAHAARILEADGRAAGVELADGRTFGADTVVWGAPEPQTPLLGQSRCTVLLALRGSRPPGTAHRTVLHAPDPYGDPLVHPVVTLLRPDDAALRPDAHHESAVLTAAVPAAGSNGAPGGTDWEAFADLLLDAAERAGLGLRDRLLWRVVRTPADVERDTGSPGGVVPGPALAGAGGAFLTAPSTGPTAGSYRVGGHAHPGGGLAHAGMSGALSAGLIVEGPQWRGSY